jgi:hypothetical protein
VQIDLMLANEEPVVAWVGRPAVDAAGVAAVVSEDWTPEAELLYWSGQREEGPASFYNDDVMHWFVIEDGAVILCHSWMTDYYGLDRLAEPDVTAFGLYEDLAAMAGPMDTRVTTSVGSMGTGFGPRGVFGGLTARDLPAGERMVATLTLEFGPVPGIYQVSLADGLASTTTGELPMRSGPALVVEVGP